MFSIYGYTTKKYGSIEKCRKVSYVSKCFFFLEARVDGDRLPSSI